MRTLATTLLGVLVLAGTAAASTLGVAPIRADLSSTVKIAVLTIRNPEDAPVVVQARPAAWSQHDEGDQLDDTHDLLVTPPLFTIPAKSEQVVRVALLRKPDPSRELDYRLVLSEVPPAAPADPGQLRVALRITLPVFVKAQAASSADVSWRHTQLPDGTLRIEAQNRGTAHVQISAFDADLPERAQPKLHTENGRYLLPGTVAHWDLKAAPGPAPSRVLIHGRSDAGDFSATSEPGAH